MLIPTLLTILIILLLLVFGGGALALLAYGLGWLLHLITKFDLFQSTLLGLAGMFAFGILAERIFASLADFPGSVSSSGEESDDEFDEDLEDEFFEDDKTDENEEDEEEERAVLYPGIPRWRQPLKQVDFSKAQPNDKCPCGSGRKFKNCHGAKRATS